VKLFVAFVSFLMLAPAFAVDTPATAPAASMSTVTVHRYLVERTFPPGALAGLDSATKQKVNANNASVGVRWVTSYANADETKTFCVYEGPNESAIRKAATLNALPVDSVTEVPVDLDPGTYSHAAAVVKKHRYLVERTFSPGALDGLDAAGKAKVNATNAKYGVQWVTSYANASKTKTFCVYEGGSEKAVRRAAVANGIPVDSVTEVPVTLSPN
jgi:hypothetical protein